MSGLCAKLARVKLRVIEAIENAGHRSGASSALDLSEGTVSPWQNKNCDSLPPLKHALALDEISVLMGKRPPITCALAREMGGVFVPVRAEEPQSGGWHAYLADHCHRAGELQQTLAKALRDSKIDRGEARDALVHAEKQLELQAEMIAALRIIADGSE